MSIRRRKVLLILLAVIMSLGIQAAPVGSFFGSGSQVYGAVYAKSELVGSPSAVQGDENVAVTIEVQNKDNKDFTFDSATLALEYTDKVTITGGSTGTITLTKGEKTNLIFYLSVGRFANTGSRGMSLTLRNDGVSVHENQSVGLFRIYQKVGTSSGDYVAALEISHSIRPEGGFSSGQDNTFLVEVKNYGSSVVKNAEITLTLPEGLSVYNESNSASLGSLSKEASREASFPIVVDDDAKSKNYAIVAKLTGLDYSNRAVSVEKTFYVPVNGSGVSVKNAEITNISVPSDVDGGDEFTLSFDVQNKNSADLKNVKVDVEIPEGLLNKSRNTFIESSIPAGSSKNYAVTMFAADGGKDKTYTLKISLSSADSAENTSAVTQYASVYVGGAGSEKTPQLMVDSYSYGGTFVQAGDEFLLELGLLNASSSRNISNIKVTVSSEDGSIIPANNSNSFYIEKLGKKEQINKALMMSVKPAAEQKTTPLTVDMSYEDGSGNAFTSKDIISIPVMQETRLEVDDVIAPPELYAGMQSGVSVQFYNMGKTTLNNLRVTAEGDFDTPESTSYFVGNMESGKSDTYDFGFIPRKGGTMEGKIIFTYEDAAGDQQVFERPFSFEVQAEMPVMEEMPPEDAAAAGGGSKKLWIILGVLVCFVGIGIFVWRKIRKRKLNREMEIDE